MNEQKKVPERKLSIGERNELKRIQEEALARSKRIKTRPDYAGYNKLRPFCVPRKRTYYGSDS